MNRADKFAAVTGQMLETYKAKNADYGNSFDKTIDKYGTVAFMTRMSDKWERIESLHGNSAKVKEESFNDTVMDMATYCIMWLMRGVE